MEIIEEDEDDEDETGMLTSAFLAACAVLVERLPFSNNPTL